MIFDLMILLIVLLFGLLGLKNGFAYSVFRFLGWVASVVGAFFLCSYVVDILKEYTMFYEDYVTHTTTVCHGFADRYTGGIPGSLPGAFGEQAEEISGPVLDTIAGNIAAASFNVIIFIFLVILIKFILFLFTMLFSKKYHKGFIGGTDGIVGCVLGVVQGSVIVLILLALLMPFSFVSGPDFYETVNQQMENSLITEGIYVNNPLLNLMDGFIPDEFLPSDLVDPGPTESVKKDWDNLV